jgi:hypothetical protein
VRHPGELLCLHGDLVLRDIELHCKEAVIANDSCHVEQYVEFRSGGSSSTQSLDAKLPQEIADRFTAADLLMTTVLRTLRHSDLVTKNSTLHAYQHRCEARPAFQKALKDRMASFAANAPA